jgi:hypothetical protein
MTVIALFAFCKSEEDEGKAHILPPCPKVFLD